MPRKDRVLLFLLGDEPPPVRIAPALTGFELVETDALDERSRGLRSAACAVLVLPDLRCQRLRARIRFSERSHPLVPRVIVTERDPTNLASLSDLAVQRVVLFDDSFPLLRKAVKEAINTPVRSRLALGLERARHLRPSLRAALRLACLSDRPIHTVARLAKQADVARSTLLEQWSTAVGSSLRLQDFLHGLELLHVLEARMAGAPRSRLAEEVGLSEKTLRRRRQAAGLPTAWLESPLMCRRASRAIAEGLLEPLAADFTVEGQNI